MSYAGTTRDRGRHSAEGHRQGQRGEERGAAGAGGRAADGRAARLSQPPRFAGRPHDDSPVANVGRDHRPQRRSRQRPRRASAEGRGGVRARVDHARLGPRPRPARRPSRLGARRAARRMRDRRAPHRSAPEGPGQARRGDRDRERLRRRPSQPASRRVDHPRHGDRDGHREPHDGGNARSGHDGHRECRPRARGVGSRRVPQRDGRTHRRRRYLADRDRGRADAGRRHAPDRSRPDRGRHPDRRRRHHPR